MLATLPAQGRWTVLLPLALTSQGWVGAALAAPVRGRPARRLEWLYDAARGLRLQSSASTDTPTHEDPET